MVFNEMIPSLPALSPDIDARDISLCLPQPHTTNILRFLI